MKGIPTFRAQTIADDDTVLVSKSRNLYGWYWKDIEKQETVIPLELPGLIQDGTIAISLEILNRTGVDCGFTSIVGSCTEHITITVNSATTTVIVASASQALASPELIIRLDQPPRHLSLKERTASEKVGNVPHLFFDRMEVNYPRGATFENDPIILERSLIPNTMFNLALTAPDRPKPLSAWVIHNENQIMRLFAEGIPEQTSTMRLPSATWERIEILQDEDIPGPRTIDLDYPSTLHRTDQGFNYVIIAYPTLIQSARKLATLRNADGFNVLLVDVRDVYDEFNYGYPDFDAIRRFLRYTQSEWEGLSPEFLTLIGDCSWDHRDNEQTGVVDQIPTYAPIQDPQRYASDEYYGYLWENQTDDCPDLIVGRISLANEEDVDNYLKKLITYRTETPVGPWKAEALFVADDIFERYSVKSANLSLGPKLQPRMINQRDFPHVTNPYLFHGFVNDPDPEIREEYTNKKYSPETALAIIKAFDRGALITQYCGHGGAQLWSDERIFYGMDKATSNLLELQPNTRFPLVLNWSCLTGYLNINFNPFTICLAEELIRYHDRGAIAVWGPTERGSPDDHNIMSHIITRSLFYDGLTRVGEAASYTKLEYLQAKTYQKMADQYILFGDPAVKLALPQEDLAVQVEPAVFYEYSDGEFTLNAESKTIPSGLVQVSCSIEGTSIYQSEPFSYEGGRISHTFPLSFNTVEHATAYARVYIWNTEENTDGWGGAALSKFQPELELTDGAVSKENGKTHITFKLENHSVFPVENALCHLYVEDEIHDIEIPSLPAHSAQTLEWTGTTSESALFAYAGIEADPFQSISATENEDRLVIQLREPDEIPIAPLLGLLATSPPDVIEAHPISLNIPFINLSAEETESVTATISGPGSATKSSVITLKPLLQRRFDFSIKPPRPEVLEYQLQMAYQDHEKTYPITIEALEKPDLALAEDDVTCTPEIPVLGQTVTFRTTVYNMGGAPARDVSVVAFDGDPSLKKRIKPFNDQGVAKIKYLEPGGMQEVEIKWDPPAYDGKGSHQIHIVADPFQRILELNETNNTNRFSFTFADLPDLVVNPWSDHNISISAEGGLPVWGQPMELRGRVWNEGDSDADYVRLSFLHNDDELTRFLDHVKKNSRNETSIEIPLVSAKNTLIIHADKYDLIGEKDERVQPGNNASKKRRLCVQLQMPPAPIANNRRVYRVSEKDEFTAGLGEYLIYDPNSKSYTMHPNMETATHRIIPTFVQNQDCFSTRYTGTKWHWSSKYSTFYTPDKEEQILQLSIPAPNGSYDVWAQLFSPAHDQNTSAPIQYKTPNDSEFILLKHSKSDETDSYFKLGTYDIKNDEFNLEFNAVPGKYATNLGYIRFKCPTRDTPISAGYLSPYFPAEGSGQGQAEIKWEADIPERTSLSVKARWITRMPSGELKFLPWARIADGAKGQLQIPGQGTYFQYYISFTRPSYSGLTPSLRSVLISIPCRETQQRKTAPSTR